MLTPAFYRSMVSSGWVSVLLVTLPGCDTHHADLNSDIQLSDKTTATQSLPPSSRHEPDQAGYRGADLDINAIRTAAAAGDITAQMALADACVKGSTGYIDLAEATRWYRAAAEEGYVEAQSTLGLIFAEGIGVERDPLEARKWYAQAADQGDLDALHWIGASYVSGDTAPQTLAEAIQGTAKALEVYTKAADAGHPLSQYNLGMMYLAGQGVESNPQQAFELIQKAADQNLPAAQSQLASMYETGHGTSQDFEQAFQWYSKAATLGDQEAARSIDRVTRHLQQ